MHENHASIVALHRLKTFFKKSADTFASTQYLTYKHAMIIIIDLLFQLKTSTNSKFFYK